MKSNNSKEEYKAPCVEIIVLQAKQNLLELSFDQTNETEIIGRDIEDDL